MNSNYDWFLGFAVASIGFGPWLLVYYLRTQRLLRKSAGKDAVPAPAPTPAPPGPCTYHLTDGRWCLDKEGHVGRHTIGSVHRLCPVAAHVHAEKQNIACELPAEHRGPHAGIDDQRRLRIFSEAGEGGVMVLSVPVLSIAMLLIKEPTTPEGRADAPPPPSDAPVADVAPAAVPSENPPSDP